MDALFSLPAASLASKVPPMPSAATVTAAQKAGRDFEAFFLSQVFENMFSDVGADPLFGGGSGETVYRSLMVQEYSKIAAKSASTGIAAEVTAEILHAQEMQKG